MYKEIEIPFNQRNKCWFCGEPDRDVHYKFPANPADIKQIAHHAILIPICNECNAYKIDDFCLDIFELKDAIKSKIVSKHTKILGIGLNWTKQELETSEFEGHAFEGFKRSAWSMYEIVKSKINFSGWELIVDDKPLISERFIENVDYEGITYKNMFEASKVIVRQLNLDQELFNECLNIVGDSRFEYVVSLCSLNKNISNRERVQIIHDLQDLESEKEAYINAEYKKALHDQPLHLFEEVILNGTLVTREVLKWLFDRGIDSLHKLDEKEDDFFDEHEHLGGIMAFQLYNTAQIYLDNN